MTKLELKTKRQEKTNKGITLIALVITIIVLLILAGISLATLTGQNGILTKANTAKVENEKATAKEKVQLIVMSHIENDGTLNRNNFQKELEKQGGYIISANENTILVEMDHYEITIDSKTGNLLDMELKMD
ncbi:MAG: hypothetical protein HFJ33_04540 [Clostridia bacterium]|nr:hypothetical protein [Clostridia bacterium]